MLLFARMFQQRDSVDKDQTAQDQASHFLLSDLDVPSQERQIKSWVVL